MIHDFILTRRRRNPDTGELIDPIAMRHHSWVAVGSAVVSAAGTYLSKPKAPKTAEYNPVNLQDEQERAIEGNLANIDDIEELVSRTNSFNADEANSIMEKSLPGWGKLQQRLLSTTNDLLTNPYDVPEDVERNLSRLAAERGINTGARGQINDFSLLRDFGVNSLQYGQSRIGQAQSLAGMLASISPKANPMSPLSFFVTPSMAVQNTTNNNQTQQAIAQGANNAGAAADNAGRASMWNALGQGFGQINNQVDASGGWGNFLGGASNESDGGLERQYNYAPGTSSGVIPRS